jgi:hypothetical protein
VHALDEVRKHSAETERLGAMSGTAIAAEAEQMRRERDQAVEDAKAAARETQALQARRKGLEAHIEMLESKVQALPSASGPVLVDLILLCASGPPLCVWSFRCVSDPSYMCLARRVRSFVYMSYLLESRRPPAGAAQGRGRGADRPRGAVVFNFLFIHF